MTTTSSALRLSLFLVLVAVHAGVGFGISIALAFVAFMVEKTPAISAVWHTIDWFWSVAWFPASLLSLFVPPGWATIAVHLGVSAVWCWFLIWVVRRAFPLMAMASGRTRSGARPTKNR